MQSESFNFGRRAGTYTVVNSTSSGLSLSVPSSLDDQSLGSAPLSPNVIPNRSLLTNQSRGALSAQQLDLAEVASTAASVLPDTPQPPGDTCRSVAIMADATGSRSTQTVSKARADFCDALHNTLTLLLAQARSAAAALPRTFMYCPSCIVGAQKWISGRTTRAHQVSVSTARSNAREPQQGQ